METRKYSNALIELVDEGIINKDTLILALINYMSEDDVKNMCISNGYDVYIEDIPTLDELEEEENE